MIRPPQKSNPVGDFDPVRFAKVLSRLDSGHDGEVLAAARGAVEMLRQAGLGWAQIVRTPQAARGELRYRVQTIDLNIKHLRDSDQQRFLELRQGYIDDTLTDADLRVLDYLFETFIAWRLRAGRDI
jgi:hypothetical protein